MAAKSKRKSPAKSGKKEVKISHRGRDRGGLIVQSSTGRVYLITAEELKKYDLTSDFNNPSGRAFLKSLTNMDGVQKALFIVLYQTHDGV